ncbi:MAG: hypothetical protein QXG39_04775 [Candidatus Aenigmatarchaeota archaeon]
MNADGIYYIIYESWKAENTSFKLTKLPENFYQIVVEYLKKAKEEMRMIDLKTLKASLLKTEIKNVKQMIRELAELRCMKLTQIWLTSEKVLSDFLTTEEKKIFKCESNFVREYQHFIEGIIQRQILGQEFEQKPKSVVLRFLKETPAIVGLNLKTYGPFKAEDVASIPAENAEILIRKGSAQKVLIQ